MYQLMVSGRTGDISTMSLTSGTNKWASRAVIILQLAAWSAVGIVLLQKGVISLQKAPAVKNSTETVDSGNYGIGGRRAKELDLTTIPLHEEFPAKVDQIKSHDAWMKHRNELDALDGTKSREKTERLENPDSTAGKKEVSEEWEMLERLRNRMLSDSSTQGGRMLGDPSLEFQNGREEEFGQVTSSSVDETSEPYARKLRKKGEKTGDTVDVAPREFSDEALLTEEIPARFAKTIANERNVEDRTIPVQVFGNPEEDFADEANTETSVKNAQRKTGDSKEPEERVNSPTRNELAGDEIQPAGKSILVGREGRNVSSDALPSNSRAQETAWESRKKVRLSHLSGGGAAAAVAMVAVGAVMLILGPAVIVLRALDERRQERRFLKLSGQDDLPPTYEQATLMDEAPRYSTLSLNTILGPPPPPSPSPTMTRVHLV